MALRSRRWDLFDLLLEWGGDLKSVDLYTVLETYNADLYERFWASGYDLTERHVMASVLGHSTSNRPLLGFVKRHRTEDPRIQRELNMALGDHAGEGNERGVALCLWAGADPHAPVLSPNLEAAQDADSDEGEEPFLGWSAIEEAARAGHLGILKRLGPDPARDDFDELYEYARYESIVVFLLTMQPPKDMTRILSWHLRWVEDRIFNIRVGYGNTGVIEAILKCGVRWEERDPGRLADIRRSLSRMRDYHLKSIHHHLEQPEICAPETYQELVRTPKMRARLTSLGLYKKPITEREKRKFEREKRTNEIRTLLQRYDRKVLYEQVWSEPALTVAKSYGVSSVWLGKVCRQLNVPVPPRGYWARVRNGGKGKKLADNWANFADGRVMSGKEALQRGFVDELGNFRVAVDRAKSLASIKDANLINYAQEFDLADFFKIFGKSEARVKIDVGMDIPRLPAGRLYFLSPTFVN